MNRIYDSLLKYAKSDIYPFHMPGHKRNRDFLNFNASIASLDVTEIFGMDNLQNPSGIILEAQKKTAQVFGAKKSFLLANGATGGVISSILAEASVTGHIIMARNSHMSAFSAIILGEIAPTYVYPHVSPDGIAGPIEPQDINRALEENPNAKTVFITSPTYEGIVSDISQISKIAHKHNAVLIVDEAHGGHFNFHKDFPKNALKSGADIVIHSLHKTLISLTQTAVLHIQGESVAEYRLRIYLNMINSSSPSYILLSSIDKCIDFLQNKGNYFDRYVNMLKEFYIRAMDAGFRLVDNDYVKYHYKTASSLGNEDRIGREDDNAFDISKLIIMNDGIKNMAELLREKFAIEVESQNDNYIIAMTSVADTKEGFNRLASALESMGGEISQNKSTGKIKACSDYPKAMVALSAKEAINSKAFTIPVFKAKDCISAEFITPYPPGIPAIIPGEIISSEIIAALPEEYRKKEIYVVSK